MKVTWKMWGTFLPLCLTFLLSGRSAFGLNTFAVRDAQSSFQDIVTWDKYSISVHGERIVLLSGEFHPFRLPSPGLWLDVFQKIRAIGYSCVSFYVDWALLEGDPGQVRAEGVFALEQFFAAAKEAGVYLIARPGPYINAEVSGGGFPGWLARLKGRVRTSDHDYLAAITPYISTVGSIIAKAQITSGGPVILLQPENEYTICFDSESYVQDNNYSTAAANTNCLDKAYMAYVEEQYRKAGILVPFILNDAYPLGNFAPGTGLGAIDIYSFDYYPLGWSSAALNPADWSSLRSPLNYYNASTSQRLSPSTPFSISEFQGGVPDSWAGRGVEAQVAFINEDFVRVFYKLNYAFRIAIHNIYMIFGGTNWGNLGHPSGYTSYDVGAAIAENRGLSREKYGELKLQANFFSASPNYSTMTPDNGTFGVYTDTSNLSVMRLSGSPASCYIVHQRDLTSLNNTQYTLRVNTSLGNIVAPQLGGYLSLNGRDSKIHLVDYDIGGISLLYSTFELFTWKLSDSKTVLVLYGGCNETHEFAVPSNLGLPSEVEGDDLRIKQLGQTIVVQWTVNQPRRVVKFGAFEVYMLSRNEAYNYWVIDLPASQSGSLYPSPARSQESVIIKAGYLIRSANIVNEALYLTGDVNVTTPVEIISTPTKVSSMFFNGEKVTTQANDGRVSGIVAFEKPSINLPDLDKLPWSYLDSLPEISNDYDGSRWTMCNLTETNNPRNLTTPTSLYASDYGYHAGSLIYRGYFVSHGAETAVNLLVEGGYAFAYSAWLNSSYLGSWPGSPTDMFHNQTLSFPSKLKPGFSYVLTVVIDHMGLDENFPAAPQIMKDPRGILDYNLLGRDKSAISWKLTGNLGGESYADLSRGPLNEGSFYAERQGYHLPRTPLSRWKTKPLISVISSEPTVGFYATSFDLHMPAGYDVPLSIVFKNTTIEGEAAKFRAVLYVNGWQFGKYVNNIGPQVRFPIPEGILDYDGENYIALIIWSMEPRSLKLAGLSLEVDTIVRSGYRKPALVEGNVYSKRSNSY